MDRRFAESAGMVACVRWVPYDNCIRVTRSLTHLLTYSLHCVGLVREVTS